MTTAAPHEAQGPAFGRWVPALELCVVLVGLFLFSDALIGPLFNPSQRPSDDVNWLKYLWLPIYGATLMVAVVRIGRLFEATTAFVLFASLIFFVFASQLWSDIPPVTMRRALALLFTTLFGLYFGSRYPPATLVRLLAAFLTALGVASVITVFAFPALGVHHDVNAGAWRGLWYEKNALGAIMATGSFTAWSASMVSRRKWPWILASLFCAALVLLSQSKTALICLLLPVALFPLLWTLRRGPLGALLAGSATVTFGGAAAVVLWIWPDLALKALGKDPTLTGRTQIWDSLLRLWGQRPLLGYGFGSFWQLDSIPAQIVRHETGWIVPSAHNGWLDILMQLGVVGLALVILVVAVVLVAALLRSGKVGDGYWTAMFVATFLVRSSSESILLAHNSLDWVLFVAAGAILLSPRWRTETAEMQALSRPYWSAAPAAEGLA